MKARIAQWWDPRTWLAFVFWELRTFFKGFYGDGLADWNAAGVMIAVEILALAALASAWSVYHQRRMFDHYIYLVALAVVILNAGVAFGGNKRRHQLCNEFESYPKPIRLAAEQQLSP